MLATMITIAPIFILITVGYGLRRGGIPSMEFWDLNDRLVYWVLMPALFTTKISAVNLSGAHLLPFAGVLYAGFFSAVLIAYLLTLQMEPAAATAVLQGGSRFNTFISLAVAEVLFGKSGLQAAVLASAFLIPLVNITIITLMTVKLGTSGSRPVRELLKNPLILGIGAGLAFNLTGYREVPVFHETIRILGNAALPILLLCVGANMKLRGLRVSVVKIGLASLVKFIVLPAVVVTLLLFVTLDPVSARVALIISALPTGAACYTLARQMGGDAPLMAAIITVQTLLSFFTLPLTLLLGELLMAAFA